MSVNKDVFQQRNTNTDFQSHGLKDWDAHSRTPETLIPTHCSFCGVQCGMYLKVRQGQVIGVEPRNYAHNRGSLCPKGVVAYQQANHPDRLRYPLIRRGGKGSPLERATWDEALDYIVSRWQDLQGQYGKDAIAIYSGSSMTNEKCYAMGKFARAVLGTRHVDYNGRLCMSSAAVAYAKAFGIDRSPIPMTDIPNADCLVAVGVNMSECFPVMMQWVWRARDRGASLIVLDPRETPLARTADLWLPVRSGTDMVVLNTMLNLLIQDGMIDEEYIRERTVGWEQVRETVAKYTPEEAQRISGVPAERIITAARMYGRAATSLIMHARGIEHSSHGVNTCLACTNLALARGQVGKLGGGTMMVTGQGNGQGGREMGQKANQLPGYRHIDVDEDRRFIAQVWGIPVEEMPWEGAAATEMIHLMAKGDIKSCMIACSNLMVSLPDNQTVRRALQQLDPLIVVDFFMSETAELADVVLPAAVWCEDEGTTTNLEGRVVKINKAVEPLGESKADWEILVELAKRMGKERIFSYRSARDIWNDLRKATKGGAADYSGMSWEKIDEEQGMFWPCPDEGHPGTPRLFTERFGHPDGKARFIAVEYQPPAEEPGEDFPFRLTTGRVVYHYLSGNQTRRLGFLNAQAPEPWVEIHPQAAAKPGIQNHDRVRITSPRGSMELQALVVPTIRPDTLFVPYHYGHAEAINQLTNPAVDPTVKIPEYKACAARIERIDAPEKEGGTGYTVNYNPENMPAMFPYAVGETGNKKIKE